MKRERNVQKSNVSRHGLRSLPRFTGFLLLVASIVRERRLPKQKRTWHGVVFGKVPYDLRPPTFDRLNAVIRNPRNSRIVVPTALGVGWTINLAPARARLSGARAA